jgi:hypothetical protein
MDRNNLTFLPFYVGYVGCTSIGKCFIVWILHIFCLPAMHHHHHHYHDHETYGGDDDDDDDDKQEEEERIFQNSYF